MSTRIGFTRRDLLSGGGRLVGAAALARLLAACAAPLAQDRGVGAADGGELRIYNWPAYIDDDGSTGSVARFHTESHIGVTYTDGLTDNNKLYDEILVPTLGAGRPSPYDIVTPTFWLTARVIANDWALPLPLELIKNHKNLDVSLLRQPVDRGARFSMPWQSGITGIATNTTLVPKVTSIHELLTRSDLKGRVGFLSEMRDSIGLAMLAAGGDPSNATLDTATSALAALETAYADKQIISFGDNSAYLDALATGKVAASVAWSGDLVQLKAQRPEFSFTIADEGGMRWYDTMLIPKGAANVAQAAKWMNFIYDPQNAARITLATQYVSPVIGTRDVLATLGATGARLALDPLVFPDDATRQRLYTWHGTSLADENTLSARFNKLLA